MSKRRRYNQTNTRENSKALSCIAICLALFMAIVVGGGVFVGVQSKGFHDWSYFTGGTQAQPNDEDKPNVEPDVQVKEVTDEEGNEMASGTVYELPRAMVYARTSAQSKVASDGIILQAKVSPVHADDKSIEWSYAYADESSAWAQEHPIETVFTVTPESNGSQKATAKCLAEFGEQIIITATSRMNPEHHDTCTVDFAQTIEDFTLSFGDVVCDFNMATGDGFGGITKVSVALTANETAPGGTMDLQVQLTDTYTLAEEYTTSCGLSVNRVGDEPWYFLRKLSGSSEEYLQEDKAFVFGDYIGASGYGTLPGFASYFQSGLTNSATVLKEKGLYFGLPFFVENLNLHYAYANIYNNMTTTNDMTQFPSVENMLNIFDNMGKETAPGSGSYTAWSGDRLFMLIADVRGKYSDINKATTFKMTDYVRADVQDVQIVTPGDKTIIL